MLDDDEHIIAETMNDDLERGLWWVQNACKKWYNKVCKDVSSRSHILRR